MNNYCAFTKDHKCLIWMDYTITRFELEEANNLCHGNWIEISRLKRRIEMLESLLDSYQINYLDHYLDYYDEDNCEDYNEF